MELVDWGCERGLGLVVDDYFSFEIVVVKIKYIFFVHKNVRFRVRCLLIDNSLM